MSVAPSLEWFLPKGHIEPGEHFLLDLQGGAFSSVDFARGMVTDGLDYGFIEETLATDGDP